MVLHDTTLRAGAPALTQDEVEYLLKLCAPSLKASLPPGVWPSVISQFHTRFKRPQDPAYTSEPSLPLDLHIQAIGDMHVHITGQPDPIVADLWRVPLGLTEALVCIGNDHLRAVQQQLETIRTADTAGSPAALTQLHDLIRLHGPVICRCAGQPAVQRTRPHRAGFADLTCQIDVDGQAIWLLTFTVRVPPRWLPLAYRHDTIGVDVGIRLSNAPGMSQGVAVRTYGMTTSQDIASVLPLSPEDLRLALEGAELAGALARVDAVTQLAAALSVPAADLLAQVGAHPAQIRKRP
ncbi:hypothetical protein [Deinococcus sp. QL22]|uniref:hypothetical protein n=1 Tax=Deinococcus sp. QL22 TaxID=2939437 RepID=UPI00201711EC|nr:hypothetical protein [Deinococcus sp. QL22]UQN08824.1 hypothetical protein M1R55_19660 [Deinococcus sp. QL22]